MPAIEAVMLLEQTLKEAEINAFKHQQIVYASSLPLYVNQPELPEPPAPPEWLQIED